MKIYLIQHGKALPEEVDPERGLSDEGKADTQKISQFLKDKGVCVDTILHSKKLRSIQTAQIISDGVTFDKMEEREGLSPNDPVDNLAEELKAVNADVMIVGHLPFLQKLCSLLLVNSENYDFIAFKNSGVVCLEYDQNWRLLWYVVSGV